MDHKCLLPHFPLFFSLDPHDLELGPHVAIILRLEHKTVVEFCVRSSLTCLGSNRIISTSISPDSVQDVGGSFAWCAGHWRGRVFAISDLDLHHTSILCSIGNIEVCGEGGLVDDCCDGWCCR